MSATQPGSWANLPVDVQRRIDDEAHRWTENLDPTRGVGSRHHIVPRAYLRPFANKRDQLAVRDRSSGVSSTRNISDLAIKDFYTFIDHDGERDGSIEQALGRVEGSAVGAIGRLLDVNQTGPVDSDDRASLAQFLSFQLVRGARHRREAELMMDWQIKALHQSELSAREVRTLEFLPHQNEHVATLARLPEELIFAFLDRPFVLVRLDQPLLITCDEPVVVKHDKGHVAHRPECHFNDRQRRKRRKKSKRNQYNEIVHIYPTRSSGVAIAEEIVLPVSPTTALVLGPRGEGSDTTRVLLPGEAGIAFADELNTLVIDNAFDWIAAHPDHPTIKTLELPPVGPIIGVCDGNSVVSRQLAEAPTPRRPLRLGKAGDSID